MNRMISRSRKRLVSAGGGTRSFAEKYGWLISDFVRFSWRYGALVVALAGISAALNVAIVSGVLGVVRKIARSGAAGVTEIELPFFGQATPVLLGLTVGGILTVAAVLEYLYRRLAYTAARDYQMKVTHRVAALMPRLPNLYLRCDLPVTEASAFLQTAFKHGRLFVIFIIIILFSALDSLIAISCFIALLVVDPAKTAILTVVLLAAAPVFYILSLQGIRYRQLMPTTFGQARAGLRAAEADLNARLPDTGDVSAQKIADALDSDAAHQAFLSFRNQRLIVQKSGLAASILAAAILGLSIALFAKAPAPGVEVDAGGADRLSLFFALLLVMGNSMVRSLRSVVSSIRFHSTLKLHYSFIGPRRFKPLIAAKSPKTCMVYERLARNSEIELTPESRVYLYFPQNTDRFFWLGFVNRLFPSKPVAPPFDRAIAPSNPDVPADPDAPFLGELIFADQSDAPYLTEKPARHDRVTPQFLILRDPLTEPPAESEDWLYVWGVGDDVVGDLSREDGIELPDPNALKDRLTHAARARGQGVDDLDEELF